MLSNEELKSQVEEQLNQTFGIFNALVGVAIFVSLFGVINTLAMSVIERTREIGVLRALGSTRWQIRRTIAAESLVIALIGAAMGIVIGAGLGYALLKGLAFGIPGVTYTPPVGDDGRRRRRRDRPRPDRGDPAGPPRGAAGRGRGAQLRVGGQSRSGRLRSALRFD